MDKDNKEYKEELTQFLISMGYRSMNNGKQYYGKPIGFTLLIFNMEKLELKQVFYDANGEMRTWDSIIVDENYHIRIKEFEAYQIHDGFEFTHCKDPNKFLNFISIKEQMELIL